ncbi:MAG: hypothetical protein Tsb0013_21430 [Phycisphaerales bacterium]
MLRCLLNAWTVCTLACASWAIAGQDAPAPTPDSDPPTAPTTPADAHDAPDHAGAPASPNRMTFRQMRTGNWTDVPFADVPPIDKGYAIVGDPYDVPYYATSWEALFAYWEQRGFQADDYRLLFRDRSYYYVDDDGRFRLVTRPEELLLVDRPYYVTHSDTFSLGVFNRGFSGYTSYNAYYDSYAYGLSRSTYNQPPLLGLPGLIDWNLFLAQPEPPEPEPVDPGLEAIADEAWNRAAAVYLARDQQREIESTDRSDLRIAAILFAMDGQIERAARDLATALADQPDLRDTPVDGESLGLEFNDLMSLQARVARAANRSGDADLWALAATLADARGSSTARLVWQRYDRARETPAD